MTVGKTDDLCGRPFSLLSCRLHKRVQVFFNLGALTFEQGRSTVLIAVMFHRVENLPLFLLLQGLQHLSVSMTMPKLLPIPT